MKKLDKKLIIGFILFIAFAMTAVVLMLIQGLQPFFVDKNIKMTAVIDGISVELGDARLLDGVYMKKGDVERYPVAVIIDNKYEARPWSGLSYAGLIFEAPVEGGITRFLALFSTPQEIEKIGPIRSARPYFIDYAMGLNAIFAHVGGSPEALKILVTNQKARTYNVDFMTDSHYWRSEDRLPPHNVYTSSDRLEKVLNVKLDNKSPNFKPWQFKDDLIETVRGNIKDIDIEFKSYNNNYNVNWKYDRVKNVFVRMNKAEPSKDLEGRMILAKNIAVLETDIWIVDSVSRRHIKTIGEGDAIIFQDGKEIKARWKKKDNLTRLRFYDINQREIEFVRGQTWVEIVPDLGFVHTVIEE